MKLSIVIPAKNEEEGLQRLLPDLLKRYPEAEIIVVNDGSTDNTEQVCKELGVTVYTHPYSKGNGAAVKSGARLCRGDYIVFMDGDGQHSAADVGTLLAKIGEGYDLVVGARSGSVSGRADCSRISSARVVRASASYWAATKVRPWRQPAGCSRSSRTQSISDSGSSGIIGRPASASMMPSTSGMPLGTITGTFIAIAGSSSPCAECGAAWSHESQLARRSGSELAGTLAAARYPIYGSATVPHRVRD